jgi:anti-sigma regulatory factor (Ser/Thr protein kinase)
MTSIELSPRPESVGVARRFVAAQLEEFPRDLRDVAQLCVSELATNCVVHAGSPFTVRVETTGPLVRVEVTDASPDPAQARQPRTTEAHGRGLQIVSRLADDWGSRSAGRAAGKTVWFVLRSVA